MPHEVSFTSLRHAVRLAQGGVKVGHQSGVVANARNLKLGPCEAAAFISRKTSFASSKSRPQAFPTRWARELTS